MMISDLDYLESMSKQSAILGGGSAGVTLSVSGEATGKYTISLALIKAIAIALPNGSSIAIGVGNVVTIAYTPSHKREVL
jgi:hypothetical protein